MKRRDFLKTTLAAAPMILSAKALGLDGPGPNETVNIGLIGLGGRCRNMIDDSNGLSDMRIVAICDCFRPRVNAYMKAMGDERGWNPYFDLREMIEKENLDGVMVETTTHARAWVSCHAMAMGVDAYIEKPMSLTIAEGREMVNIARKYKRVTQIGTQQRSIALNNWASDLVKNGALGKVTHVLAPNFVAAERWSPQPEQEMPDKENAKWWDIWTNQAELRPYHRDIHLGWSRWLDYDGGGISFGVTGWGTHSYDQIQRGLGTDETGPVEVILEEALHHESAGTFDDREPSENETGAPYYGMVRGLAGNRAKVKMVFASGTELHLHLDADNGPGLGCIFVGEKGRIEINRDRISADPVELIQSPDRPGYLDVPETQPHIADWVKCIKTREKCTADVEYGHRSTTLCYLVNIAREVGRVGEALRWDPVAERFTNCDEGNAMLALARREGYELPT
jgi:predicted dehydrogenase